MNVQFLKYIIEVAKAGSLNKAAESLGTTQPNLTRAIKELEKELNIEIFERNTTGMALTQNGEKLISYGRNVIKELDNIENIFIKGTGERKVFSISVPRAGYVGYAMSQFSLALKKEKEFEVLYNETNAQQTLKNITEEDYHLGIIRYAEKYEKYYEELFREKGLVGTVVTEFQYLLLMNKNNPMSELKDIHYSDLENYIEIAHADPYVPSISVSLVRKEELPDTIKRRIFVFERASQYEMLAKNEDCYMWVSPCLKDTMDLYGLAQKKCADNTRTYRDVLIYKKDYQMDKLDQLFIDELTKAKSQIGHS